jgi:hypothetical protein
MNELMFTFWADRLAALRDEDRRLDAVLDLAQLENALREPGGVDLFGVASVYKARLLRRQAVAGNGNGVLDDLVVLVEEVMALSNVA